MHTSGEDLRYTNSRTHTIEGLPRQCWATVIITSQLLVRLIETTQCDQLVLIVSCKLGSEVNKMSPCLMFIMLIGALNSLQSKSLHKNNCGLQPSTRLGVKYMHEYLKYKIPSLYLKYKRKRREHKYFMLWSWVTRNTISGTLYSHGYKLHIWKAFSSTWSGTHTTYQWGLLVGGTALYTTRTGPNHRFSQLRKLTCQSKSHQNLTNQATVV